jgi:hypothetical protein
MTSAFFYGALTHEYCTTVRIEPMEISLSTSTVGLLFNPMAECQDI